MMMTAMTIAIGPPVDSGRPVRITSWAEATRRNSGHGNDDAHDREPSREAPTASSNRALPDSSPAHSIAAPAELPAC